MTKIEAICRMLCRTRRFSLEKYCIAEGWTLSLSPWSDSFSAISSDDLHVDFVTVDDSFLDHFSCLQFHLVLTHIFNIHTHIFNIQA